MDVSMRVHVCTCTFLMQSLGRVCVYVCVHHAHIYVYIYTYIYVYILSSLRKLWYVCMRLCVCFHGADSTVCMYGCKIKSVNVCMHLPDADPGCACVCACMCTFVVQVLLCVYMCESACMYMHLPNVGPGMCVTVSVFMVQTLLYVSVSAHMRVCVCVCVCVYACRPWPTWSFLRQGAGFPVSSALLVSRLSPGGRAKLHGGGGSGQSRSSRRVPKPLSGQGNSTVCGLGKSENGTGAEALCKMSPGQLRVWGCLGQG